MKVRLQKYLSEAGVASRRASEQLIIEGRVAVNGRVQTELGCKIDPVADTVALDGKPLKAKRKLYIALNKPRGYVCSRKDEEDRKLIGDLLPKEWTNLYSVGRLDRESEGLIFLTNDGEFSLKLTHPRYGVRKIYVVGVAGPIDETVVARLKQGIEDEGELLKASEVRVLGVSKSHSVLELELTEGKNREVRRMFESMDFKVERLQRIQIGPIKLGDLRQGRWRTLNEAEVRSLTSGEIKAPERPVLVPRPVVRRYAQPPRGDRRPAGAATGWRRSGADEEPRGGRPVRPIARGGQPAWSKGRSAEPRPFTAKTEVAKSVPSRDREVRAEERAPRAQAPRPGGWRGREARAAGAPDNRRGPGGFARRGDQRDGPKTSDRREEPFRGSKAPRRSAPGQRGEEVVARGDHRKPRPGSPERAGAGRFGARGPGGTRPEGRPVARRAGEVEPRRPQGARPGPGRPRLPERRPERGTQNRRSSGPGRAGLDQ